MLRYDQLNIQENDCISSHFTVWIESSLMRSKISKLFFLSLWQFTCSILDLLVLHGKYFCTVSKQYLNPPAMQTEDTSRKWTEKQKKKGAKCNILYICQVSKGHVINPHVWFKQKEKNIKVELQVTFVKKGQNNQSKIYESFFSHQSRTFSFFNLDWKVSFSQEHDNKQLKKDHL